ncbi:glycine betaine ABC transporter substrate-binding protein [Natranaerobius thermophilus]|uniref:Substrate-binding region of ABC-type glycine betaine transport system n=1 Tax=Natranaerobius thermophilus (strain ATCC BAA-1301 / DSM 18059 / JW/NM-WN-LF) TaxID=457570 RepID=B2A151_NATTJ|nr:glycine betaine ABC transporter substrate-binding protein [Natranaerobius thermophilus]ACB84674.1 Substrate-binding region of ABC-type glycine betaine transport system [Natranaerobius thermophilus JW/NM-WN-LF]
MSRTAIILVVAAAVIGAFFIFTNDFGDNGEAEDTIEFGFVNWACSVAKTHTISAVLENEMNYDTQLTMADAGPVYADVAAGDQDAFVSAWLPVTHQSYYEDYGDDIVDLGPVYEGARIGLVVPEYLEEIDSIEEMDEYEEEFDTEIVGIDAGAGIMGSTDEALETYESLENYTLTESSDAAMTGELGTAINNEEWIVVTGWTPHWKFAEWDLKFLEDPEQVYGEAEDIHVMVRENFDDDQPDVNQLLENFYLEEEELGEIMAMIDEMDDEQEAAEQWIDENQDIVEEWLPEE